MGENTCFFVTITLNVHVESTFVYTPMYTVLTFLALFLPPFWTFFRYSLTALESTMIESVEN